MIGGALASGILIVCDHASNAIPPEFGTLGLPEAELQRHIAYDIGAEGVTRGMAARLECPAVLSRYSRLLIDPNRGSDDPTLVMRVSDGAVIQGNRHLDAQSLQARIARFYAPYHNAIESAVDTFLAAGIVPVIVSMHSFTPVWKGKPRPWHAGVLWDKDPRLAVPLITALAADPELVVGDNEPYSGVLRGDTMWQHATRRGLAHALIEVRQDLISTAEGQDAWSERLARILLDVDAAAPAGLHKVELHGSHAGL